MQVNKKGRLFIVIGSSGSGKTTLVGSVVNRLRFDGYRAKRIITYTSKTPRAQERDGADYYFLSKAEFSAKIKEGFFLEWSDAYGSYYGSPSSLIDDLDAGYHCFIILDRDGAERLSSIIKDAVIIGITVPSIDVLRKRLFTRGDKQDEIVRRIALAKKEIAKEKKRPLSHYCVFNKDVTKAIDQIIAIVLLT